MKSLTIKTLFAAITMTAVAGAAQAASSLPANTPLGPGQTLESANGKYMLVQQNTDGNLVVYRKSDAKVIWTTGKPAGPNAWAVAQADLNFVVYTGPYPTTGTAVWSSGTHRNINDPTVSLNIGLDGSLYLARSTESPIWTTPGDSSVCPDGNPKTAYPICMRPGTKYQMTSYVSACTYAQAQVLAGQFVNDGAVMGACH